MADELIQRLRAEGSARGNEIDCLEQIRFPLCIVAKKDVEPTGKGNFSFYIVAKIFEVEVFKIHQPPLCAAMGHLSAWA